MDRHDHGHQAEDHRGAGSSTRRLALVLAMTGAYAGAEFAGGMLSNSLALLADAGHMLTDMTALALALAAAWFAKLPPDPSRTYGYQRAEILAALVNGVALVVICLFLFVEAWRRLFDPPRIDVGLMALVASGGLIVNLIGAALLRGRHDGLNVRAAYLHVLGDLLGSVGTLVAAVLVAWLGWRWADPAVSFAIGAIIVVGSTRLVLQSLHVLMEGAPGNLDIEDIRRCLLATRGVSGLHDLHLWSLSGGRPLLTAHLVVDHSVSSGQVLREATRAVEEKFGIVHSTIQVEPPDFNIIGRIGDALGEEGSANRGP